MRLSSMKHSDIDKNGLGKPSDEAAMVPLSLPDTILPPLDAMINHTTQHQSSGAALMIHFDNLSMILNAYGHQMAEQVISDINARIQIMLTQQDQVMRLQRDQLLVLLATSSAEETETLAMRIHEMIQHYGRDHFVTSALHVIGYISAVHFPDEGDKAQDVLDRLYTAMFGQQQSIYRPYSITRVEADQCRQEMGLASYLHAAYAEKRLRLAWQPVIDVSHQRVSHYEALLRIINHNGKISSAGPLIPIAEKVGLIADIDMLVLHMVVEELRRSEDISIAVNVSNVTAETSQWLDRLEKYLEDTPDIASRLIVEITETAVQRDLRQMAYFVASVQAMGCQVALDDFGSGYTSFRQLKSLSVDYVKIDGVFIRDIAHNADSRFFVKTMLDFIRGFGLKSVAEYVENGETAKILMDLGVDYLQGYYLGKPSNQRGWADVDGGLAE